jgi:hypothetical protein
MSLLVLVVGAHSFNNIIYDAHGELQVSQKLQPPCQEMTTKFLKGECQQCAGRIEFPAEAIGMPTQCPHCGKQTELMLAAPPQPSSVPRKAVIYAVIAFVILVGGLAASLIAVKRAQGLVARQKGREANPSATANPSGVPTPESMAAQAGFRVSLIKLQKSERGSIVYALGNVRNETDRKRFGVKVELDLLDNAGRKVSEAKDYHPVLEPKESWEFKALVIEPRATTVKLAAVKEDQ